MVAEIEFPHQGKLEKTFLSEVVNHSEGVCVGIYGPEMFFYGQGKIDQAAVPAHTENGNRIGEIRLALDTSTLEGALQIRGPDFQTRWSDKSEEFSLITNDIYKTMADRLSQYANSSKEFRGWVPSITRILRDGVSLLQQHGFDVPSQPSYQRPVLMDELIQREPLPYDKIDKGIVVAHRELLKGGRWRVAVFTIQGIEEESRISQHPGRWLLPFVDLARDYGALGLREEGKQRQWIYRLRNDTTRSIFYFSPLSQNEVFFLRPRREGGIDSIITPESLSRESRVFMYQHPPADLQQNTFALSNPEELRQLHQEIPLFSWGYFDTTVFAREPDTI